MTNRVRHLATSARKRNVVRVEAFFPLLVKGARDVRGVRAFRTTTRMVVLGLIPLLNIRDRGPGLSYQKGRRKRTRPPISFDVPGQGPARFDLLLDNKKASLSALKKKSPVSHQLGAGHVTYSSAFAF